MILVITYPSDLHAKRVTDILRQRGQEVDVLNYGHFPYNIDISFHSIAATESCLIDLPGGIRVKKEDISSVYHRRPKPPRLRRRAGNGKIREYIVRESSEVIDTLPQMLPVFWLCHPDRVRIASRKAYQLGLARQLGFNVPITLITNSEREVKEFLVGRKYVAVKTLYSPGIEMITRERKKIGMSLYTRRLSADDILAGIGQVGNCPFILQDYVEKEFELRVTVVGKNVFACAMYTQKSETAREDFRRYDLMNTPHLAFKLPYDIEQRCLKLTSRLGLHFGCIDLIVDPEGKYHFLELNPNGQWLWTEDLAGLPISSAVADLLSNPPLKQDMFV